jgi:sodium/proline symporter
MAIEKVEKIKLARRVASVWVVISMAVAIVIGVVGYGVVKSGKVSDLQDSERIIIEIAKTISGEGIGLAIVAGLILSGILAATMSTADSQLLAASSSISEDIITALKLKVSDKKRMLLARISVVIIAIIAMFIAKNPDSKVFEIVSFAWAGFGATFGPVVLFALFYKRTNKWGALAGMVSGAVMVFVWKFVISKIDAFGGILAIYELLPAFIFSAIVIVIVSLITKAPSKEIERDFDIVRVGGIDEIVGEITDVKTAVVKSNSVYYVKLDDNPTYYSISILDKNDAVMLAIGDKVSIIYEDVDGSFVNAKHIVKVQ